MAGENDFDGRLALQAIASLKEMVENKFGSLERSLESLNDRETVRASRIEELHVDVSLMQQDVQHQKGQVEEISKALRSGSAQFNDHDKRITELERTKGSWKKMALDTFEFIIKAAAVLTIIWAVLGGNFPVGKPPIKP